MNDETKNPANNAIESSNLVRRIEVLESAIRDCVSSFDSLSWGWDGDCGSEIIIEKLEDSLDA